MQTSCATAVLHKKISEQFWFYATDCANCQSAPYTVNQLHNTQCLPARLIVNGPLNVLGLCNGRCSVWISAGTLGILTEVSLRFSSTRRGKCCHSTRLGHHRFFPNPFKSSSLICHPTMPRHIVSVLKASSNNPRKKNILASLSPSILIFKSVSLEMWF
jgi:hypothetical protein